MSTRRALILAILLVGCPDNGNGPADTDTKPDQAETVDTSCEPQGAPQWQVLSFCRLKGELLSVWGTGRDDVWTVGAQGQVLHFDGCAWTELDSGTDVNLWWVFGFKDGPVFMAGEKGTVLRYSKDGAFESLPTGVEITLFGIWGSAPDDMWTIGFTKDDALPGAILRFDGTQWSQVTDLPDVVTDTSHFFKVWGSAADDVWVVGTSDLILHWDGANWTSKASGMDTDWVTITGRVKPEGGTEVFIVGGASEGVIVQRTSSGWASVGPAEYPGLQGICIQPDGSAMATGVNATLLEGIAGLPWSESLGAPYDLFDPFDPPVEGCAQPTPDYHACYADGEGGFFAVGGNFLGGLSEGAMLYFGPTISTEGL